MTQPQEFPHSQECYKSPDVLHIGEDVFEMWKDRKLLHGFKGCDLPISAWFHVIVTPPLWSFLDHGVKVHVDVKAFE